MVDKGPPQVRAKVRHLRWAQHHSDGAVELVVRKLTAAYLNHQVLQRHGLEFLLLMLGTAC